MRKINVEYQELPGPYTAWKVPKYGGFSGLYFPTFGLNMEKYGPEKNFIFGQFSCSDTSKVKLNPMVSTDDTLFLTDILYKNVK